METNSSSSSMSESPKDLSSLSFWDLFEKTERKEIRNQKKKDKNFIEDQNRGTTDESGIRINDHEAEANAASINSDCIPSYVAQKLSHFTTQHLPYCISSKFSKIVSPIVNNQNPFTQVFMPDSGASSGFIKDSHDNDLSPPNFDVMCSKTLITKLKTKDSSKKYQKYLQKNPSKVGKVFDLIKNDIKEFGTNDYSKNFFLFLHSQLSQNQRKEAWKALADQISFTSPDNSTSIILLTLDKKETTVDEEIIVTAFSKHLGDISYCKNGISFLLRLLSNFSIKSLKPVFDYVKSNILSFLSDSDTSNIIKKVVALMKHVKESEKRIFMEVLYENASRLLKEKQGTNLLILIQEEWGTSMLEKFIQTIESDLIQFAGNEHSNKLIKCLLERNEKVICIY